MGDSVLPLAITELPARMMRRRSYLVRRRSSARALWMMRSTSKLLLQAALHQYEEEHTQTGENFVRWRREAHERERELEREYQISNFSLQTYTCDLDLLPGELSSCFVELQLDDETHAFLEESQRRSSSVCLQLFYTCMYIVLGLFLSQTSINGWESLSWHVFSSRERERERVTCLLWTQKYTIIKEPGLLAIYI